MGTGGGAAAAGPARTGMSRPARRRDEENHGDALRRGRRRGAGGASSARPVELGPSGEGDTSPHLRLRRFPLDLRRRQAPIQRGSCGRRAALRFVRRAGSNQRCPRRHLLTHG